MCIDRRCLPLILLLAAGCGATRHALRPNSPQGYTHIEIRDIGPMGLEDINVEVEGQLGPITTAERCDVLLIPLIATMRSVISNGQVSLSMMSGSLTLSLPRNRYPEIRDPHGLNNVRVRGYLTQAPSESCAAALGLGASGPRYLWVDTIEWQAPPQGAAPPQMMIPPPPAQ